LDAGVEDGPPGSLGIALTAMRSVAVDPRYLPLGSLLFLQTTDPLNGRPLARVVVAQDTGAAITGPIRADLFCGSDEKAERLAGLMKQPGTLWRLVLKASPAAVPSAEH
jgi:membrane-bound lytic murein transglycosylase A